MPTTTTTTTVTGGGATTTSTVTATVAGGDAVQDTPAVALIKDLLASWGAGKLIEEKGKFFSKDMVLVAGPGTIPSWGTYNFDTLDVHLTEQAQYDFNDFELVRCAMHQPPAASPAVFPSDPATKPPQHRMPPPPPGLLAAFTPTDELVNRYTPTSDGCFMEWSVSSFGLKATGQKTGPCSTTQKFIVADGKVTHCSLTFSNFGAIEALVKAANVDVVSPDPRSTRSAAPGRNHACLSLTPNRHLPAPLLHAFSFCPRPRPHAAAALFRPPPFPLLDN
jgi:hypothetical protein